MKKTLSALFIAFVVLTSAFAQNDGASPVGATTAQDLFAPSMAGRGGFTTSQGGAPASALNPAAEGEAQRIIFDLGYLALLGLGSEDGFGSAINLGAIIPTRYAVFGGSVRFLHSPFDSFPLGTSFSANLNAAKEIFPRMSVGAGLNIGYSNLDNFGLTLSADLGFRYNVGNLGPLENFTWAVVARSLGLSKIPPMFTPAGGVSFDFFRIPGEGGGPDPLRMSFAADLMFPTLQNMAGKAGLQLLIAEFISISTSTQFNIRESVSPIDSPPSAIPSIGLGVNWSLRPGGRRIVRDTLPSDGELALDLAAKPLYSGVWAMGGGLTWTVGVADSNPPVITINYDAPMWISPNNDGLADYLEFPISIRDERYVMEWIFEISDETGATVREIRNREIRPQTQGVQNIIDRLRAVRGGVEIPPTLRWDGVFDSGEIAPDGRYFFTITATDDNGNTSTIGPFEVNVDNTPPEITLEPFDIDNAMNIFSPGDEGDKPTLTIIPSGSREELWTAGIYDASGARVRTFVFIDAEPPPIVWDGTDSDGLIVPDGIYTFRISSTDRARNSGSAYLTNIIVNTIRPHVGLLISAAYFSPNGDGIQDTMNFTLDVPVQEGIVSWNLQIIDAVGEIQRNITGGSNIPARFEFDGRDNAGRLLPEAVFSGILSVRYQNGHLSSAVSPPFTLDITPPQVAIQIDGRAQLPGHPDVFAPNTDSPRNELFIFQQGSSELSWIGEVRRADAPAGPAVRTFRFTGTPPSRIMWDGITDAGSLAPDGFYIYELFSTDSAGNTGRSNIVRFEINTRDAPVLISTDIRAFSPNGDGIRDTISLIPHLQDGGGVVNWRIDIRNVYAGPAAGAGPASLVRSFSGTGIVPASVVWDGRTDAGTMAPDGSYVAMFEVEHVTGLRPSALSMAFTLDTISPQAEISVPFTLFAPNANGRRDALPINVTTEGNDEWDLIIVDSGNNIVRSWNWTGSTPAVPFVWDGRDNVGNNVPDGTYSIAISSTDEAGNSTRRSIYNIVLDARVPAIFLTASAHAIAPRPNQTEAMRFNIVATIPDGIDSWRLELRDENDNIARVFPSPQGGTGILPTAIPWNGTDAQTIIREGRFTPTLTVYYTKGDIVTVSTPPVLVDISGPELSFRSTPEFFSPDNDGVDDELFIFLSAIDASPIAEWYLEIRETEGTRQLFYRIEGRGTPAERIIWDGRSNWGELVQGAMDYEYTFRARDILGNTSSISGRITTDVLIIRDGDILRIQVPSITFRANFADFVGISEERMETNNWVLRRIAGILNRFRDYQITVEGHANPVIGTLAEEINELQPLSLARAQFVIEHLVSYGVTRSRLSPIGRGGTMTLAEPHDQDNNWKNRRVEFLLIR